MPNPVVGFQIATPNPDGLATFYREVFGWTLHYHPDIDYTTIATDAGGIKGGLARMPKGAEGFVCLYIEVDNVDYALSQIAGSGGHILAMAATIPYMGTVAMFADPEGHPMALVQSNPDYSHHEYRVYEWPPEPSEGAVIHFEILGVNTLALQHFYRNVFGWFLDPSATADYGLVDTHTIAISGAVGHLDRPLGPVTVFIQTAGIAATLRRIEAAGGATVDTSHLPEYALFTDPEGNLLGLLTPQD